MNPNSGEAPRLDVLTTPGSYEVGQDKLREYLPPPEGAVGKKAPTPSGQPPATTPLAPLTPPSPVPTSYPPKNVQDNADDSGMSAAEIDRIEKEWVDKAKAIVAKTRDDPHAQKSQMSKVKADYIKKRFNKTLPTDDAVTI